MRLATFYSRNDANDATTREKYSFLGHFIAKLARPTFRHDELLNLFSKPQRCGTCQWTFVHFEDFELEKNSGKKPQIRLNLDDKHFCF